MVKYEYVVYMFTDTAQVNEYLQERVNNGWRILNFNSDPQLIRILFERNEIPDLMRKLHQAQDERHERNLFNRRQADAEWRAMPGWKRLVLFWRKPKY